MERQRGPDLRDYQTVFTNAKAGMQGVDKEHVKKVVYEMSKDSAHFKNEQRKQEQVDARIQKMKERAAAFTPAELAAATRTVDQRVAALEAGRDLMHSWIHVDMDAFYASVEELERPELRSVPMAVGGLGMICTSNYIARRFGVRAAMPGFIARRLCPQLVFVKPDFKKYTAASERTRAVFRRFDPCFEAGSLDEAYLDVTDYCARHGLSGEQVAEQLRKAVRAECELTCSCGVAPNKMLAKVCSDINKPDGQYVLQPSRDAVMAFLHTLPVRKIPGIGKVSEQELAALGMTSCGALLEAGRRPLLALLFSDISCGFFLAAALGIGTTRHAEKVDTDLEPGRRGISCERTFRATSSRQQLEATLTELCESLAADMAREAIEGRTLTLKVKLSNFEVRTRAASLVRHVSSAADLLAAASKLLAAELPLELRLMGVRMANLRKVHAAARSPLAKLLRRTAVAEAATVPSLPQQQEQPSGSGMTHSAPPPQALSVRSAPPGSAVPTASTAEGPWLAPPQQQQQPCGSVQWTGAQPQQQQRRGPDQQPQHHHPSHWGIGRQLTAVPPLEFSDLEDLDHSWLGGHGYGPDPHDPGGQFEGPGLGLGADPDGFGGFHSAAASPQQPAARQRGAGLAGSSAWAVQGIPPAEDGHSRPSSPVPLHQGATLRAQGRPANGISHATNGDAHAGGSEAGAPPPPKRPRHAPGCASHASAPGGPQGMGQQQQCAAPGRGPHDPLLRSSDGTMPPPAGAVNHTCLPQDQQQPQQEHRQARPLAVHPAAAAAGSAAAGPWACRVCTYAHNRREVLRCELCDCLRGSTSVAAAAAAACLPVGAAASAAAAGGAAALACSRPAAAPPPMQQQQRKPPKLKPGSGSKTVPGAPSLLAASHQRRQQQQHASEQGAAARSMRLAPWPDAAVHLGPLASGHRAAEVQGIVPAAVGGWGDEGTLAPAIAGLAFGAAAAGLQQRGAADEPICLLDSDTE